ncbi:MAG: hypothetical protein HY815_15805 [Candidatus Riflebacteria bacterium]|nr:hypothetical protein [Candidatus Riflebacteria bacterium]
MKWTSVHERSSRPGLPGLVVLMLAVAAAAAAQAPEPITTLQDRFDPRESLVRIAGSFFPESAAPSLVVTQMRHMERFSDGFRYDTFDVRDQAGKTLGQMVRIQVFPDVTCRIDFAVKLLQGKILAAEPLRPMVLGGKPFTALPLLFEALKGRAVSSYAGGLARIFHGLSFLEQGAKGPPPQRPRPPPGASPEPPLVTVSQPSLDLGEPVPAFNLKDLAGRSIVPETFKGRPLVVVLGRLQEGMSRESLGFVATEVARYPGFAFLPILVNTPADVNMLRHTFKHSGRIYTIAAR